MRWSNQPAMPVYGVLYSAIDAVPSGVGVVADHDQRLRQILVRRNRQVVGRWLVLEHAAGQIERRPVARTEETLVGPKLGYLVRTERPLRRTAEVGADADCNQVFRLARTVFVTSVFRRRILRPLRLRIRDLVV